MRRASTYRGMEHMLHSFQEDVLGAPDLFLRETFLLSFIRRVLEQGLQRNADALVEASQDVARDIRIPMLIPAVRLVLDAERFRHLFLCGERAPEPVITQILADDAPDGSSFLAVFFFFA